MTRDDIINALTKAGFKIAPKTSQLIIYAYKAPTSIVCSILAANATVSVSFGGLPDLDKAKKLIKKIFGVEGERIQNNPLDGVRANYFSLGEVDR